MPDAATREPALRATRRHVLAGGGAVALLAVAGAGLGGADRRVPAARHGRG
jgi:hypothetical protein